MSESAEPVERWSWLKFLKGPFEPKNYAKMAVFATCAVVVLLVLSGAVAVKNALFPPPPKNSGTTSSIGKVEAGGVVKNITIQSPKLQQGIYLRGASDRASVGVFKEVMSNIDISLGAGKDYDDEDGAFVEVEARFKF